jgi:HAD superfamily hydrolase (TIGR01509 family)
MDGTIVDTEDQWTDAALQILRESVPGAELRNPLELVGLSLPAVAGVLQGYGVHLDADAIVERQLELVIDSVATDALQLRPGAAALLAAVAEQGIPQALVTMSYRSFAEKIAEAVPGSPFATVVAGDDVAQGKPEPDAYLLAASRLGVDVSECVVIEDSPVGLRAGRAAGAATIGVPCHLELTAAMATAIWPTLTGRTPADLHLPLAQPLRARHSRTSSTHTEN